jgi:sugar phosphate isomerase/epimerase
MVTLSGFGDEIAADFSEQMDVMESVGIHHIELRGAWGTGVDKLTDDQLKLAKQMLHDRGFGISAIGSGLGKIGINDDFDAHLRDCEHYVELAKYFDAPFIRLFSFYIPEGDQPGNHREEVMRRMRAMVDMAAAEGIAMAHENERGIYGEKPVECRDILDTIDSKYLGAIFDPANFIQAGVNPLDEGWPLLKDDIVYFHIKDAQMSDGAVRPAGEGDGEIKTILADKLFSGWEGVLSLEPHLKHAGKAGGYSGPEAFVVAAKALQKILDELGVAYN